ncbi:ParB/RepB/Spo0J family partition protein [Pseudoxanthomonas sp. JBR18]|uniref:ParB/RepB/Spo0J family partition protein n=1 Tax=Pseudoxanthomonas sp. JBR18 TaxID=2969308 RepID=UPI002304D4BE|nr:ParB/RepB/Spo0J family partition protein [Pseudoxanthomonas sp. JBR18]WCE02813.1 ParB/RepB/Spo0J family partition protein [Pseudoxanthomonas sp. JBR18]
MSNIQQIPLDQLRISPRNARRTGGNNVDDLAASIRAEGLLQNLVVTRADDGLFDVVAGGRRLTALQQLRTANALPEQLAGGPTCSIVGSDVADEASLAENTIRADMHPADQVVAYKTLVDEGKSLTDIAARFSVTELFVRQRLKLANVRPELFELFRNGEMRLEQLQALALTDNHELQRQAWFSAMHDYQRNAWELRDRITRQAVPDSAKIAKFVGIDAYVAAGGALTHDLFNTHRWLADPALVDKLAMDKLEAKAESLRADGWSWVEPMLTMDYEAVAKFPQVPAPADQPIAFSPQVQARMDAIDARLREIEDIDADDLDEEEEDQLGQEAERLEDERLGLKQHADQAWPDSVKAVAGVLVGIGDAGGLRLEYARLRPGQKVATSGAVEGSPGALPGGDQPKPPKLDLSAAAELTLAGHRSEVIRAHLAADPHLALAVSVHCALQMRNHEWDGRILGWRGDNLAPATGVSKSLSAPIQQRLKAAEDSLKALSKGDKLLPHLIALPTPKLQDLNAILVALSFSSTSANKGAIKNADLLHQAIGFDMAEHWNVSCDDFISRAPRALVVKAVSETKGKELGEKLDKLKKDERVAEATKLLTGTGWLPKQLRGPGYGKPTTKAAAAASDGKPKAPARKAAKKTAAKKKPTNVSKAALGKKPNQAASSSVNTKPKS